MSGGGGDLGRQRSPVTVGVADDQALVRRGLRLLLDHEPDIVVVGEATDGPDAVELARRHHPDVLLVDLHMPGLDGIETTARIVTDPRLAGTAVAVLTTYEHDEYVDGALRAGASGYLLKDSEPDLIVCAVRAIAAGGAFVDPVVTRRLIARWSAPGGSSGGRVDHPLLASLTGRELEVLELVAAGRNNAEIASALVISVATARTHVGRILQKLGARDRSQLVVLAFRTGLVDPGGHPLPK